MNVTTIRKPIRTAKSAVAGILLLTTLPGAWPTAMAQPLIGTQPRNATVSLGASVQFRSSVISTNQPIMYQWWFKEAALDAVANPSAAKNLLSLTNVTLADGGPYFVVVSDTSGSTTSQVATLTVDPTFTKITTGPGEPTPVPDYGVSLNWWDYDSDGFLDLFVANGGPYGQARNRLYHNNRDGTFTRFTNVISTTLGHSICAVVGDYDNDGNEDLFVVNGMGAPQYLYRNDGVGSFTPLTQQQVGSALGNADNPMEATWVDYDRDGFLDLFRANQGNDGLYRNNGDGTLADAWDRPQSVHHSVSDPGRVLPGHTSPASELLRPFNLRRPYAHTPRDPAAWIWRKRDQSGGLHAVSPSGGKSGLSLLLPRCPA